MYENILNSHPNLHSCTPVIPRGIFVNVNDALSETPIACLWKINDVICK